MNRSEIDAVERDEVEGDKFLDALKQVLLAPLESRPRSENGSRRRRN